MPRSGRSSYGDDSDRSRCRRSSSRRGRHERHGRYRDDSPRRHSHRSRSRSRSRLRSPLRRRERNGRHSERSHSYSRHRHEDGRRHHARRRRYSADRRHREEHRRHDSPSSSRSPDCKDRHAAAAAHDRSGHGCHQHHQHRPSRPTESSGQSSATGQSRSSTSFSRSPSLRQEVAVNGFVPQQDSDGHLKYNTADCIGQYEIGGTLGEGTFGKVVSCTDHKEQRQVAVKIIKRVDRYRAAAMIEIDILRDIADRDRDSKEHCIHMLDSFEFHGHVCLVFNRLGLSLYDVLDKNGHHGYPMQQIRHISHQVASGLKFLHRLGLTHTDLKPENILFVSSAADQQYNLHAKRMINIVRDTQIKLIDFGSATYDEDHHGRIVATRHYRPIEIILELEWTHSLDMWSLGCIMYELYTGRTLFQTHSNREHMAMMEEYIGRIPQAMVKRSPSSCRRRYFHSDCSLDWDRRSRAHRFILEHSRPLKGYQYLDDSDPDVLDLFDIITWLLTYEPKQRCTASQALRHRFFDMYN